MSARYILFDTNAEKYLQSEEIPGGTGDFDIIDTKENKVISGPQGSNCELEFLTEEEEDPSLEAEPAPGFDDGVHSTD